jgi:hypothetical protein
MFIPLCEQLLLLLLLLPRCRRPWRLPQPLTQLLLPLPLCQQQLLLLLLLLLKPACWLVICLFLILLLLLLLLGCFHYCLF